VNTDPHDLLLLRLLRCGAFMCFAGWAWQHTYWEGPYGPLFWQGEVFDLASALGGQWDAFVGSGAGDGWVQRVIAWTAWPYIVCMVLSLTARARARAQLAGLVLGSACLAVLAYAKYVASLRELPMLIEHGGQVLSPILLALALVYGARHRAVVAVAVVAVVTTFAAHGAYALGLWPTPASFYGIPAVLLGSDDATTTAFLRSAGALDFAVCVGLLVPAARRSCMLYAALWGLLTAAARPAAGMSTSLSYWGADQFLHEAVLRAPHFVAPLYLALVWRPADAASAGVSTSRP